MKQENRKTVIENYYRATNALMNIGIVDDLPDELKNICIKASAATYRIIDYVNEHKL